MDMSIEEVMVSYHKIYILPTFELNKYHNPQNTTICLFRKLTHNIFEISIFQLFEYHNSIKRLL